MRHMVFSLFICEIIIYPGYIIYNKHCIILYIIFIIIIYKLLSYFIMTLKLKTGLGAGG